MYNVGDKLFVGFWKNGKRIGVGKMIQGNVSRYGVWKDGNNEKWFNNEEEFLVLIILRKSIVIFFQWKYDKIKSFMKVNEYMESFYKQVISSDCNILNTIVNFFLLISISLVLL